MNRLSSAFFATALLLVGIVLASFVVRATDASFALTPAGVEQAPPSVAPAPAPTARL